jgi:hypothetical protein
MPSVRNEQILDSANGSIEDAIEYFRPKPSPFRLIRVGGRRDGAYLVPDDLKGLAACFSPGVANFKAFEDDLARRSRLRSHLLDFSSDEESFTTPVVKGLQFFEKKWLAPLDNHDSISMESWVGAKEPNSDDLLLQMDIEGAEYSILSAVPPQILRRFRIMVIEFHDFRNRLASLSSDPEFAGVIGKLARDFVVIHARANNCRPAEPLPLNPTLVPPVLEVTFLRNDRFEPSGSKPALRALIPHPLDITRNIPGRPPLHLGGAWLEGPRPLVSVLKIWIDFLGWFLSERLRHWPYKLKRAFERVSGLLFNFLSLRLGLFLGRKK